MDDHPGSMDYGNRAIAVIDITGVITDADTDRVDKALERYGNNDSIKAIILHIDSPGGGAAASQEIYHEVMRVREQKHKKVVASVESVGASGAYYIASACDRIYANPASVVGSIGVIMEWTNYGDLTEVGEAEACDDFAWRAEGCGGSDAGYDAAGAGLLPVAGR